MALSEHDIAVPGEQLGRQAMAGFGGYLHQLLATVAAWMRLNPGETLLIELAEDFAVVTEQVVTMTQVKRDASARALTLRREEARKAVLSLWQFSNANPGRDVRLHFLTTANPGHEQGVAFPEGLTGIGYWARVALGADVEPLRAFLLTLAWPEDLARFLAEAEADQFRARLVRRIYWLTGADTSQALLQSLEARLGQRAMSEGPMAMASDGARALPMLVLKTAKAVLEERRSLTLEQFEQAWREATNIPVPISAARRLLAIGTEGALNAAAAPGVDLDPLPIRLAPRAALVDRMSEMLRSGAALWIHGSSGLGKSRLAQLVARRSNASWHVARLRGLSPAEAAQALREAAAAFDRPDLAGIILDDLPVPLVDPLLGWVRALATQAAQIGAKLIVTSARAPLVSARLALEPYRLEVLPGPYLTQEDVADMVRAAGGDAKSWVAILHLTCGGGHPLFVDARIAGLASRGWPKDERILGLVDPATEVAEVRSDIALRLLRELDADTHTLLLRLSAFCSPFDRELALAVAAAHRALPRPGTLFDFLVGPWVENAGDDQFKLSPLLVSAGAAGLDPDELAAVRASIVDHLLARRPFPGSLLSELLIQASVIRHVPGLGFVAGAIMTSEHRALVARSCIPLAFLSSKADGKLVPEQPGVSANLRIAQVIAITALPNHPQLISVLGEADREFDALPEPIRSGSRFTVLLAVLANEELEAPPSIWVPCLKRYCAMIDGGEVPVELTEGITATDLNGLAPDEFFFALRAGKVGSPHDLERLFEELVDVAAERRHGWLTASSRLTGGPPLFIQTAWARAAQAPAYDAAPDVAIYRRLASVAEGWGEIEVAIECHRSAATLLDEYLEEREAALAQLDNAETVQLGAPGIARSRATILAHAGRHAEADRLLAGLRDSYSGDEPVERALMLQSSGISAARAGDRRRAATLFREAHSASEGTILNAGIRVGLLCDAAVEYGAAGDLSEALVPLAEALDAAAPLEGSTDDREWLAVQAVSQVAQWLLDTHKGRQCLALADHPGSWSALSPKLPEDRAGAVPLEYGLARAAILEGRLGSDAGLRSRYDTREAHTGVTPLSSVAVWGDDVARSVDDRNVDRFVAGLPILVAASHAALQARNDQSTSTARIIEAKPPENWEPTEIETARQLASELIAELLLDGEHERVDEAAERLSAMAPQLGNLIPRDERTANDFTGAAVGALAWMTSTKAPDPDSLLAASFRIFQWLTVGTREGLRSRVWTLMRDQWVALATDRAFMLAMPVLAVPAIEMAAHLPGTTHAHFASLIRAGGTGARIRLSIQALAILARYPPDE